jgi:hypothetical protein
VASAPIGTRLFANFQSYFTKLTESRVESVGIHIRPTPSRRLVATSGMFLEVLPPAMRGLCSQRVKGVCGFPVAVQI